MPCPDPSCRETGVCFEQRRTPDAATEQIDLAYNTPTELALMVLADGKYAPQALEELRKRALHAPFPFTQQGTM